MDSASYKKLKNLGILQIFKYIGILILWEGAAVLLFFIYHSKTGANFTDPSGIGWVIMMLAPFAFKIHKKIIDSAWTGVVKAVKDPPEAERSSYSMKAYTPSFIIRQKDIRVVTVERGKNDCVEIILVGDEVGLGDTYYHLGDKVVKFRGLKYPVNYTINRNEIFCPVCGRFNKMDKTRCYWCKSKLTDPERNHKEDEIVTG